MNNGKKYLYESRLSGSVGSQESEDFAGLNLECYVDEGCNGRFSEQSGFVDFGELVCFNDCHVDFQNTTKLSTIKYIK